MKTQSWWKMIYKDTPLVSDEGYYYIGYRRVDKEEMDKYLDSSRLKRIEEKLDKLLEELKG